MRSKEMPRKVSCVTSDLKLECSIVHSRIQDVTLQACGFTQATPTAKELNLQVLLRGTAAEMVVDVACLDTAGTVIAHLPAITRTITHDNKHSQAASFTKARTHACVLARQLQDSQSDIKELLTEVADWQKVASETTAQLQQRDIQVADLQRQLKEPKPRSRLGLGSKHPFGPPKPEGIAQAASDELGHLHTQVEGVESTIATLRTVVTEQEQQLRQQDLQLQQQQLQEQQPADQYSQAALKMLKQQLKTCNVQLKQAKSQLQEHKDQVMQLKHEVKEQQGQADQAQARAASVQTAHDRIAQQLELAQTELRQHGSDVSAKVAETKQQAAQELQEAREQLQLHSQLLQEQDEEVQKLRKLLEVQHEQMTAQEQQQSRELNSLQEGIREQQEHAAELQQRAVRQEAEDVEQQKLVQKLSQHLLDAQQQVQQLTEQLQQHQSGNSQSLAAQQHSHEQAQLLLNKQDTCSRQEALLRDQQAVVSDLQQKVHDEQQMSRQQEQSIADLTEQFSQLQQSVLQQTETDLGQLLTAQREQLRQQDSELQRQQQALDQKEALLAQQQQQISEQESLRQEALKQVKQGRAAQQQAEDRLQSQTDLLQQQEQEMQQQSRLLMHHEGTLQRLQEQLSQAAAKASAQSDSSRMERLEWMLLQLQTVLTSHVATVNPSPRQDTGIVAKTAVSEHHNQEHQQPQLSEEAGQPQRQLKQAESQMRQMKAELTLKKAVLREQRQELSHKDSLVSQCKEELHGLTTLVQQQRQELCTLERQVTTQHQQASQHVHMLQKQQDALAGQSATVQKLQEQLGHSQEATQAKQGELDSRTVELQQRQHVIHDQHAELRARSGTIVQLQIDLQRLNTVVKEQQKEMAVTGQLVAQRQQLLAEKELFLSEQHEQLLQQDGLLRQQRELLVNQDTALQAYRGSASPRARWGHIHLQLAHRFALARHRRHLSALLNHWLFFCRHSQQQQNKLQQFEIRHGRRVLLACIKGWAVAMQQTRMGQLLRHAEDACQLACLKSVWHAWKGYSKQQGMYGSMITSSRRQHRQRSCRQVLHHWGSICTVRALLQQQGRAATRSLQVLRLKQAWQLWRRAHRAALAARQQQYSKMVYEVLKELESSEKVMHGKEQACKAAQYEVASHQLQIEASRERLEGAKEEVGLSQEALLQEQHFIHHLQRQAREDIASADQAVRAVANLLHQVAPDGVRAAALGLRQAKETAAGMLRLPRSLAQWAHIPAQDPMLGQGSLPSSRLSQILLKHFHPAQADHARPALVHSSIHAGTGHADMHAARVQSHYAASPSANPRVCPYDALPFQQQFEQAKDNQRKPRHPAPAAVARQTNVTGSRAEQLAKPAAGAGRLSRGPAAKQRPHSAGSNAVDTSKSKPALITKRKARPQSVSPGSQYQFRCTSSVSDDACSWYGHADTATTQQGELGKGRAGVRCPAQRPLWQTRADPGPVHTTYVVPDQLLMSPAKNSHALCDQQVLPQNIEAQLLGQTEGFNSQGPHWLSDAVCDTWTEVQPTAGLGPHAEQQQHQQQEYSQHQQQGLTSPPATPGGCSIAPPLEPPSTIQPAGVPRPLPIVSPFMQRVAHQMQLDAELLSLSQTHTQAQQQMLQRDAESLSVDQRHRPDHRAQQAQSHYVAQPMTDSVIGARLHTKTARALHKPEQGAQHGLTPQHERSVKLAEQASTSEVSAAAASHLQSQVTVLASPPSMASVHTKGSQQTSRVVHAARIDEEASNAKGPSSCQVSHHVAESHASGQKSQTSRLSPVRHGQSGMHQQHSPSSRQPLMQRAGSKQSCCLTPDASSKPAGVLPSSQPASNSTGDGHCMGSAGSGRAVNDGARIAGQHVAGSNLDLSNDLGTADCAHQITARPVSVRTDGPALTSEAAIKPSDLVVRAVHSSLKASFGKASSSSPNQARRAKSKGRNSWANHVPVCWTDNSCSSCGSSSSVGTGPVMELSAVQGVASESVMMPLELPSPMPCTSSEEGEEAGGDVFDAATGRPWSMDALSNASLQPGKPHASFAGLPDQTDALLLHEKSSRSFSLKGCGDVQLADQEDSKQLELLSKYGRASQAQQPAAPQQKFQLQSPSQLNTSGMHHLHSSPVRQRNKSSAILQSLGNQKRAFIEGLNDQASQEQLHRKSVGSCALPVEACSEDTSQVIAGKARSFLKGSNAWPPPSPSPKKPLPSPNHLSAYPNCSQNRQPARGLGVSQAATWQRHTDVMALHQRLRSRSTVSSTLQSRLDR